MSNKRTGPMPQKHVDAVQERSRGMCERCLVTPATNIHHRLYLSAGGRHNIANLLHLCGAGNVSGCHGEAHTGIGREVGTSISRHTRLAPHEIPFTDLLGREWVLDDDGGKHAHTT